MITLLRELIVNLTMEGWCLLQLQDIKIPNWMEVHIYLLYGYGSYGSSMSPGFSTTRLSLINRDIIWVTAHIRGGMERGMKWWKEGKLT